MPSPFLPGTLNHIDNFGIWGKTSMHSGKKSPLSMKAVFLEGQTFLVWLCLPPPHYTTSARKGVAYDGEEYGISLNYLSSQGEFNEKNTYTHLMLSGRYSLTEYVKATLSTGRLTWDNETKAKTGCWFAIAGVEFKI